MRTGLRGKIKKLDYKWIVLSVTTIGALMAAIDSNIVLLALPDMMQSLHADLVQMTWVIMSYILVSTVILLTLGRMADMLGRVRMYNLGFVTFTLGSILCGLSGNATQLILFRMVQGAGGAMMVVNSAALLTEVFPPNERGRALGINGITFAVGGVLGPVLGGIILSAASWRWIFFINLPIGIIGTIWGFRALHETSPRTKGERFDMAGAATFSLGLLALLAALTLGHRGRLDLRAHPRPLRAVLGHARPLHPAGASRLESRARFLAFQESRIRLLDAGGHDAIPGHVRRELPHRLLLAGCPRLRSAAGGPAADPDADRHVGRRAAQRQPRRSRRGALPRDYRRPDRRRRPLGLHDADARHAVPVHRLRSRADGPGRRHYSIRRIRARP
jgi:hypothetical protein